MQAAWAKLTWRRSPAPAQADLKRLTGVAAAHGDRARELITEAKRTAAVHTPHIAQVCDICLHPGEWLLAMEHVAGTDLRTILAHPLDPRRFFALQLAEAVETAHACGAYCTATSSPQNVMIGDAPVRR